MGEVQLNRRFPILSHSTWTVNYSCNLQVCKFEIHFSDHTSMLLSLPSPRVTLAVLRGLNKNGDHSTMALGRSSVCWSHCAVSNRDRAALSSRNPNSQYLFSYLSELNQSPLRSMKFSINGVVAMSFAFSFLRWKCKGQAGNYPLGNLFQSSPFMTDALEMIMCCVKKYGLLNLFRLILGEPKAVLYCSGCVKSLNAHRN